MTYDEKVRRWFANGGGETSRATAGRRDTSATRMFGSSELPSGGALRPAAP